MLKTQELNHVACLQWELTHLHFSKCVTDGGVLCIDRRHFFIHIDDFRDLFEFELYVERRRNTNLEPDLGFEGQEARVLRFHTVVAGRHLGKCVAAGCAYDDFSGCCRISVGNTDSRIGDGSALLIGHETLQRARLGVQGYEACRERGPRRGGDGFRY